MSSCIVSAAEASSISWKQVCLFQASEQFYAGWWYKSNLSPFLEVGLLINSHSKNVSFTPCFPINWFPCRAYLRVCCTLLQLSYTLPFLVETCHTFHMSQQSRAASPAASREGAERGAWLWKHSPCFSSGQEAQSNAAMARNITGTMQRAALDLEATGSGKVTSGEILTGINSKSPR